MAASLILFLWTAQKFAMYLRNTERKIDVILLECKSNSSSNSSSKDSSNSTHVHAHYTGPARPSFPPLLITSHRVSLTYAFFAMHSVAHPCRTTDNIVSVTRARVRVRVRVCVCVCVCVCVFVSEPTINTD